MGTVTNPLGNLLNGMVQGYSLAHQIKNQAMQEEAHQRSMAAQDHNLSVQAIQDQMMLEQNARQVGPGGMITDRQALPGVPGMPDLPEASMEIVRPVDKSRKVTYKNAQGQSQDYELYTPEEQVRKQAERTASTQSFLEDAKTRADARRQQGMRKFQLAAEGGGSPASGFAGLGIPDGTPLTRQEFADAASKTATMRKEGMLTLGPGQKAVDVSGTSTGGAPRTVATGGEPLPTDDFGKYFLPAYAAKALKKPLAEITPEDMKSLSPEQVQDAFGQFGDAKETPDTKAMRKMAMATQQLHQTMLQMQQGQMPTRDDAKTAAQMVINHQMSPSQVSTMFGGFGIQGQAFKRMVVSEVWRADPKFNYEEAESEYGLVKSPAFQNTVRYMDSVQESIPRMVESANKLARGNFRGLNSLINSGAHAFNGVDLKQFNTDRILVADEIAKILQGGGSGSGTSDAKLKQAGEVISADDSPQAIARAMGEVQALIGYRRKALTRGTYMEGTSAGSGGGGPAGPAQSGQVTVTDPNGGVHTFNDQKSADGFKAAAGIR